MSISAPFNRSASPQATGNGKRPAPFSLRLNADERARLEAMAAGQPLGHYIKSVVLAENARPSARKRGLAVRDKGAVAQALALLGRSRLSSNLNQLAHAVNIGILPVTPETEAELFAAARDVRKIRRLLMRALGHKPEGSA